MVTLAEVSLLSSSAAPVGITKLTVMMMMMMMVVVMVVVI